MSDNDTPEPTENQPGKPWWKRWWGILAILLGVFLLIGMCADPETTDDPVADDTQTESPTAADEPADDPTAAEPSIAPSPSPIPSPEPIDFTQEFSGSGDSVIDFDIPGDEIAIATITHQGSQNFTVWGVTDAGDQVDLFVNKIGSYQGTRLVNLSNDVTGMDISADGSWTVTIKPLLDARVAIDGSAEGTGDDVLLIEKLDGSNPARITHSGSENFTVWAYGGSTGLLVNEIGSYEGTVRVPSGTMVIDVAADGAWTFELQ